MHLSYILIFILIYILYFSTAGHGQSEGYRFHVNHFDTYVCDALELMKEQKQFADERGIPFIVFGHSMGGLVATLCMLEEPELFSAGILSSPCLMVCSLQLFI